MFIALYPTGLGTRRACTANLAIAQHSRQSALLSRGNGQAVHIFDPDPAPSITAPLRRQAWLPLVWAPVAFRLIYIIRDSP